MQEADIDKTKDSSKKTNLLFYQEAISKEVVAVEQLVSSNDQQIYAYRANKVANKLKEYLSNFITVNCYDEIRNFILGLPEEQLININCNLNHVNADYSLNFSKIKTILESNENKILFPSIIPIAIKLKIGDLKATYEVEHLNIASFKDNVATEGELLFTCKLNYPLVRYLVTLVYEIKEINITIPLITLCFENKLKIKYSLVHMNDIFEYAEKNKKHVEEINSKLIKEYAKDFWEESILVLEKSITHKSSIINLNKLTNYVVDYILNNNCLECKVIKEFLLREHYAFYFSKFNRIFIGYQNIVTYAKLAGLSKDKIDLISGYFDSKKFNEDIINLPLASTGRNISKFTLLYKYINLLDEVISYINLLCPLLPDKDGKENLKKLDGSVSASERKGEKLDDSISSNERKGEKLDDSISSNDSDSSENFNKKSNLKRDNSNKNLHKLSLA